MMPVNLATPGFLKMKAFWNKGYGVIISVFDVTYKISSRDSLKNWNFSIITSFTCFWVVFIKFITVVDRYD